MSRLSILLASLAHGSLSILRPEKPSELGIFGRLPLEVRAEIWKYAQTTRTGKVTLLRMPACKRSKSPFAEILLFDPHGGVRTPGRASFLPLLQTSKAIYQETKGLFYQVNTFCFHQQDDFANLVRQFDNPPLSTRIKHVWIGMHIAEEWFGDLGTPETAKVLSKWQEEAGTLKTITFHMTEQTFYFEQLVRMHSNHEWMQRILSIFKDFQAQSEGLWKGVTRRLLFCGGESVVSTLIDDGQKLLECLHDAFKGELWVDGKLCYKDGTMIARPPLADKPFWWNARQLE
ncbi:MAG: hypothetical protein Q9160_006216 [Pyrenula sp. 1 TL-2023]